MTNDRYTTTDRPDQDETPYLPVPTDHPDYDEAQQQELEKNDLRGKPEARAALTNARSSLIALHAELDVNAPESDEVARIITEIRRSLERLDGVRP